MTLAETAPRILVVDDDPAVSGMLVRALARHGFAAEAVPAADEAVVRAEQGEYAGALVDLVMPGDDGATLAQALRKVSPGLLVAVLTGYPNSPLIKQVEAEGTRVFAKPLVIEELVTFLEAELPRRPAAARSTG